LRFYFLITIALLRYQKAYMLVEYLKNGTTRLFIGSFASILISIENLKKERER
jgi:hypothetical protein